ncbi:hypothetical protein F383_19889 [Gossypium arboreum]|uniref:Uncharacterized protein n=2 Tax=Gossypium arboreum TaxID=29729 RepID=A0A0B0NH54_GOSAR|nr:hypothetical protein F383_19889 [Gossypium arboreum]
MFRSRTKEIGFGSGENKSCRLAVPFRFTLSEILDSNYKLGDRQQSLSHYPLFWYLIVELELWHIEAGTYF